MRGEGFRDILPVGYSLLWYELLEVLGRGGYGITYLALDRNLHRKVAIKEYLPLDFACRESNDTVRPMSDNHRELFEWGLQRFLVEARTLAKFNHPSIIRVLSVFEENHTAYMVMEYEEGSDLSLVYKDKAEFSEKELLQIFIPVIEGLSLVHAEGFIHRDIKPSNIYIRQDGSSVLLDFGSARQTVNSRTRALTSVVTAGYAPFEQYNESEEEQGVWTDIYGLGSTMYYCITGEKPTDALKRGSALIKLGYDPYEPVSRLNKTKFSPHFLTAVDHALMFHAEERPHSALHWANMLLGNVEVAPIPMERFTPKAAPQPDPDATVVRSPSHRRMPHPHSNSGSPSGARAEISTGNHSGLGGYSRRSSLLDSLSEPVSGSRATAPSQRPAPAAATPMDMSLDQLIKLKREDKVAPSVPPPAAALTEEDSTRVMPRLRVPPVARYEAPTAPSWKDRLRHLPVKEKFQEYIQEPLADLLHYVQGNKKVTLYAASVVGFIALIALVAALVGKSEKPVQTTQEQEAETVAPQVVQAEPSSETSSTQTESAAVADTGGDTQAAPELTLEQKNAAAEDQLIAGLLKQAKLDIEQEHYLEPKEDNAVFQYQKILTLSPGNPAAEQGLLSIAEHYAQETSEDITANKWDEARINFTNLKSVPIESDAVKDLQAQFDQHNAQIAEVEKALRQADKLLKQNKLTAPKSQNALALYQRVLDLDPGNEAAREGLNKIVQTLSTVLQKQLAAHNIAAAESTFDKIEQIDPAAPVLKELESRLDNLVAARKKVKSMLQTAQSYFIRGRIISPKDDNALSMYRAVLQVSPNNEKAKAGIERIYDYYIGSLGQYVAETNFDKADEVMKTLEEIGYSAEAKEKVYDHYVKLFERYFEQEKFTEAGEIAAKLSSIGYGKSRSLALEQKIKDQKSAIEDEPKLIDAILAKLKLGLEKRDFKQVAKLSKLSEEKQKYLVDFFDEYREYSVRVTQTDHDAGTHSATAKIQFSEMYDRWGDALEKHRWVKLEVKVARNDKKQWKVIW